MEEGKVYHYGEAVFINTDDRWFFLHCWSEDGWVWLSRKNQDPAHHHRLRTVLSLLISTHRAFGFSHASEPLTVRSEFSALHVFNTKFRQFKVSPCIPFHIGCMLKAQLHSPFGIPSVDSIFQVHFRGCLISFHFHFFTVTLYKRPICQRAAKSHYSYTCGKNRPFILIAVVNTNQWGYWSYFSVCIKSLFFFRDCGVLFLWGRRTKSSLVIQFAFVSKSLLTELYLVLHVLHQGANSFV